jgi:hypothetical protein
VRPEGLGELGKKNFIHVIGSLTCDFPAGNIVP